MSTHPKFLRVVVAMRATDEVIGQHVLELKYQTKHKVWLSFVQFIQDTTNKYTYFEK